MTSTEKEMAGEVRSALIAFVDFLYAVVFGIVLANFFENVLQGKLTWIDRLSRFGLVAGVFYFLTWDWLHGRILTLKNPLQGYWRFFLEVLIAFCGYGAALGALNAQASLLLYIAAILLLGVWWSKITLREFPQSLTLHELEFIVRYQTLACGFTVIAYIYLVGFAEAKIAWWMTFLFLTFGTIFIFVYELYIPRPEGVLGGPGIPFINREEMAHMRAKLLKK